MKEKTRNLTDHMEGFIQERCDYTKYDTSFRRWIVQEVESKRMTWQEVRSRFNLHHRFDKVYKEWQRKYSEEIIISLASMTEKERADFEKQENHIKELEKQLELAQMKNVALNTMIDIAEQDYKLNVRKKFGPKQ